MRCPPLHLATIVAFLVAAPSVWAATTVQKVKNDRVAVTESTLGPGETVEFLDQRPSAIVYLAGNAASIEPGNQGGGAVRRGETVFVSAQASGIRNAGSGDLRFVRVAFLGSGSSETWGMKGLPPNYKMIFENRYARTYDIRIAAHSKEQLHTHHDRVVVTLSGAKLEHLLPDGRVQPSTLASGEVAWRLGQTHVGHNIGDTNLWVIAIEPK